MANIAEKEGVLDMLGMSSSWMGVKGSSIRQSVEKCFELGFDLVELGAAHEPEEDVIKTTLDLRNEYPEKKFTLHGLYPPVRSKNHNNGNGNGNGSEKNGGSRSHHYALNLADSKEHDATIKIVKKMFDIADKITAEMVGIHGGFASEVRFEESKHGFEELVCKNWIPLNEAKRNMRLILEELVHMAEKRAMPLAIEISPPVKCAPMTTNPESFEWMFDNFDSKYLGMLVDVGHLHMSAKAQDYDPFKFLRQYRKKIFEVHLHDVKYGSDHFAVGTGVLDFGAYVKAIGKTRMKKIPVVFEYNNSVDEELALRGKRIIEDLLSPSSRK